MNFTETLHEYAHRKLVEYSRAWEVDLPTPSSSPLKGPSHGAVLHWFACQDEIRNARAATKKISDRAFKERMQPIKAAARRKRDADRKKTKRLSDAHNKGIVRRARTNCSAMTVEEKLNHKRKKEREKKARQRAKLLYKDEWHV